MSMPTSLHHSALAVALALLLAPPALAQDHAHHAQPAPKVETSHADHAGSPGEPVPPVTDADRAAAFPDLAHSMEHGAGINHYVLVDRLEAVDLERGSGEAWELQGWVGGDIDRLWFRSEGERARGHTESADVELLYGHSVSPWWDLVAGVKHDFKPGDSQTWAAFGVQGMSPYKFEIEATAYLGEDGRSAASFEAEYDVLLTNRLILQPLLEVELHGKDDPRRGIGSGLSTAEAGLRLRYEVTRQFAPYIGVLWF
jgi:copper resistance protein B